MTSATAGQVRSGAADVTLVCLCFAAAVAVRVAVAGPARAASVPAGLLFAAILAALAAAARVEVRLDRRSLALGLAGAALLVAPVVGARVAAEAPVARPSGYLGWALVTAVVATAEEAFLRGALFTAVRHRRGDAAAVVAAAAAFAALHVPLYGWHVLPVDLAVGIVLGVLRLTSGGWTAPAVAHVGADLAGWWLL